MKINDKLLWVSRIFIGIVFIFSGFVKAVDPMGTQIKITDYFIAFNAEFLIPFSMVGAFILCSYELPLGVAILFGSRSKLMSKLLLILMIPFTLLTLYLAIENPVSDCGCFGDAIILTNWQTFYKNIIIMVFAVFIYLGREKIKTLFEFPGQWSTIILSTLFTLAIGFYSIANLPIMDFRPYKVGNNIQKLMTIPDDKQGDIYETTLVYKNKQNGKEKDFSTDNIPSDGNWQWVETKNVLVKKGYTPPIHDFKINDEDGNDLTEEFLNQRGYRLLIVYTKIEKANTDAQQKLNELVADLNEENEVKVWALTSSLTKEIDKYSEKYDVKYPINNADLVTLETIIRSNPGLVLFKENTVVKKWPARRIPDIKELNSLLYK
ncbi:MAG: DoxX family protein [Bacteroidota bacterium]|nr:DoxX family protein [Bacteroidota bacterium]